MHLIALYLASGLAFVWLLVHLIIGGRDIVRPLLAAPDLPRVVRDTHYICWHFTSAGIAAMAGFFLWAALADDATPAIAGTVLAALFTILGIALVIARGGSHSVLPQGWLFLPVTALGLWGIFL